MELRSRTNSAAKALRRWPTESFRRCRKKARRNLDWLELPRDVMVLILRRLDQAEILTCVQFVCSAWLHICRGPHMWRSINLHSPVSAAEYQYHRGSPEDDAIRFRYEKLCLQALHYSDGHLTEITIDCFGTDDLLLYISQRSRQLKCLRLRHSYRVSRKAVCMAVAKLPILEELEIFRGFFLSPNALYALARLCPNLKTLKINGEAHWFNLKKSTSSKQSRDNKSAFSIAKNFPNLRHLEVICNAMDDDGLSAILDGCPCLESLDLLLCFNLDLSGDLRERCYRQIKYLRLPLDGALDEVNQMYRPLSVLLQFVPLVHTLQERKPYLISS